MKLLLSADKHPVCLQQHTGRKKKKNRMRKQSNMNSTLNTQWAELRGDAKVAQTPWKRISGIKYWSQIHNECKGGNQPRESLLWFDSICINPPNYAFNKWSSPRELLVHSRLAYSRLHNHRLVWGKRKKTWREKERKRKGGEKSGMRVNNGGRLKGKIYQTDLFVLNFISQQQTATAREITSPYEPPANLLIAGLFHSAP